MRRGRKADDWRSGRDSNPRYGFAVYSLSRRAPSTTRPPLPPHPDGCITKESRWKGAHLGGGGGAGKVAGDGHVLIVRAMTPVERLSGRTPTAADVDAVARRTLALLPSPFRESLGEIVLAVEEVADAETARRVGLDHPMQLSGLYEGVSLNHRSVEQSGTLPERITLYVRPIVAEWRSTGVSLDRLVSHIVIHEVGHHFGFSDEDMHALERSAE